MLRMMTRSRPESVVRFLELIALVLVEGHRFCRVLQIVLLALATSLPTFTVHLVKIGCTLVRCCVHTRSLKFANHGRHLKFRLLELFLSEPLRLCYINLQILCLAVTVYALVSHLLLLGLVCMLFPFRLVFNGTHGLSNLLL